MFIHFLEAMAFQLPIRGAFRKNTTTVTEFLAFSVDKLRGQQQVA